MFSKNLAGVSFKFNFPISSSSLANGWLLISFFANEPWNLRFLASCLEAAIFSRSWICSRIWGITSGTWYANGKYLIDLSSWDHFPTRSRVHRWVVTSWRGTRQDRIHAPWLEGQFKGYHLAQISKSVFGKYWQGTYLLEPRKVNHFWWKAENARPEHRVFHHFILHFIMKLFEMYMGTALNTDLNLLKNSSSILLK